MEAVDPSTGERIGWYEEDTQADINRALENAYIAWEGWCDTSIREREELISSASSVLEENKRRYAQITTKEMGKPISQSIAEIKKMCLGLRLLRQNSTSPSRTQNPCESSRG